MIDQISDSFFMLLLENQGIHCFKSERSYNKLWSTSSIRGEIHKIYLHSHVFFHRDLNLYSAKIRNKHTPLLDIPQVSRSSLSNQIFHITLIWVTYEFLALLYDPTHLPPLLTSLEKKHLDLQDFNATFYYTLLVFLRVIYFSFRHIRKVWNSKRDSIDSRGYEDAQ